MQLFTGLVVSVFPEKISTSDSVIIVICKVPVVMDCECSSFPVQCRVKGLQKHIQSDF